MKRQGKDMLLILTLVVVGLLVLLLLRYRRTNGGYVEVRVSGSVTAVYPLDQDGTYPIEGVGGSNLLVIENGACAITEADCPDKLCVGMGKIHYSGQSIICLPHQVVVAIVGENPEIDEIAG